MSLVGNLEDLGLGEILQIVNLSRKSGVLELVSGARSGRIYLQVGQIVRATATTFPENLGDLLLRAGLVDLDIIKRALCIQQEEGAGRRIGDILVERFGIDRSAVDAVVSQQIERIVCSFFAWKEGSFVFELGEAHELAAVNLDPLQFILDNGLNAQWLALEGTRLVDELEQHDAPRDEAATVLVEVDRLLAEATRPAPVVAVSPPRCLPPGRRTVLVIDDDPFTAEQLARQLQSRRGAVRVFTAIPSFLAAVAQADPATTFLLIDLIMPCRDGNGRLGGLQLLEEIRQQHADFPVLVMAEHVTSASEEDVRRLGGLALLGKPGRDEIRAGEGEAGLATLMDALCTTLAGSGPAADDDQPLVDIGNELYQELGEDSGLTPRQSRQSPGLHLLRGMLQELGNPSLGGGIILLILRFASELMNRAVIFLVRDQHIIGLGQFGIDIPDGSAEQRVRSTRIPTTAASLFSTALFAKTAARVNPTASDWDNYLFEQLGGQRPAEAFIGPLVSEGRVVAILYGDNLPSSQPVADTEALEIFLSQAGLAMEKALLEQRLMQTGGAR
jgi:CheY-like chemotaxis protein